MISERLKTYLNVGDPSWANRRRFTMGFAIWAALLSTYLSIFKTEAGAAIVMALLTFIGGIFGIYTTAATADDHLKRKAEAVRVDSGG